MRLFIALNLPEKARNRLYQAVAPLRDAGFPVRWTDPDHYHLTLKFLGEVRKDVLPIAERVIERVVRETKEFPVSIGGIGAFPTIRLPNVIWVGVEPSPALRCLKQDLEWGLAGHGFERETRAFHPHITIGRIEGDEGAGAFRGMDGLAAGLSHRGKVAVKSVDLMRSQLLKQGPIYTLLRESPLRSSSRRR
jgi:2'-5' RNA ligase